jgi:hypothetical protein
MERRKNSKISKGPKTIAKRNDNNNNSWLKYFRKLSFLKIIIKNSQEEHKL